MKSVIDNFKRLLEKIDNFRDKVLFLFIKPYWPRKITPNHITWVRVYISIILFVLLFWFDIQTKALILSLFCLGALTDLIDGSVARGLNEITKFGIMFDPLADRLLILPIAFYSLHDFHKWLLLTLIMVELVNAIIAIFSKSREIYTDSNIFGKTKMVLMCIVFIAILFMWPIPSPPIIIYILWLTIPFSVLSMFVKILELNSQGYIKNKIIVSQLTKYENKTQSKNL